MSTSIRLLGPVEAVIEGRVAPRMRRSFADGSRAHQPRGGAGHRPAAGDWAGDGAARPRVADDAVDAVDATAGHLLDVLAELSVPPEAIDLVIERVAGFPDVVVAGE